MPGELDNEKMSHSVIFCKVMFTHPYRIRFLFTHENIDCGAIFVTKGSCAALISKGRVMYLIGVREYYNQIRKAIQYCMNIASSFSFLIFTTIFNTEGEIQPSRLLAPCRLGLFCSGEKRAGDGCIRRLMIVSKKSFIDYSNEFSNSFANYLNCITPKRN